PSVRPRACALAGGYLTGFDDGPDGRKWLFVRLHPQNTPRRIVSVRPQGGLEQHFRSYAGQ
ncbi:hypothetical protein, partial [Brucella grignonensis]|uniref:hypothetical protein n=1 Tax=Brucella grignonensis TaxID=94627 RepID=UPI001ABFB784